jgi:hypothetical protein
MWNFRNIKEYAANILAENMLSQLNPYGYNTILLKEIIDYSKVDSAVPLEGRLPKDGCYLLHGRMGLSHG